MWLNDKWHTWQMTRATRYLARHPGLGLDVLRRDQELAARAFERFTDLQAAGGADGPHRQSAPYPFYSGVGWGGRSPALRTLPKPTPFNLRRFSEYPPARRAINVLTNPILDMPFTIAVRRPLGAKAHEEQPEPTAEQHARILAATEMLIQPNDETDGRTFLEMLIEDMVVLGAAPFEVQDNMSDHRPLFLFPIDAQSIRINMEWVPGSDTFHYSQGRGFLFGSVGIGDEVRFTDEELCYPRLNPRTSNPFGYGYLEVAFEAVNSFIGAFQFATRRASNETPNFGLFLGENMTPEQVRTFQHYWENEIEGNGKVPILGGGRQPTAFTFSAGNARDPLWIAWQEYLIRIIAMAFGVSPMRLSLERDVNRSTAQQSATDDFSTVAPIANTLRSAFTHWLLWKRLGWLDLEFQWQVKSSDELRQANILVLQYEANAITVDELRQVYERPPLPDGLGDMTKTAYESAIKAAAMPEPVAPGMPGDTPPQAEAAKPPKIFAMTPFANEADEDTLSPAERAFVRALLAESRYGDLADVAG